MAAMITAASVAGRSPCRGALGIPALLVLSRVDRELADRRVRVAIARNHGGDPELNPFRFDRWIDADDLRPQFVLERLDAAFAAREDQLARTDALVLQEDVFGLFVSVPDFDRTDAPLPAEIHDQPL